jgi:hypothetical protein
LNEIAFFGATSSRSGSSPILAAASFLADFFSDFSVAAPEEKKESILTIFLRNPH